MPSYIPQNEEELLEALEDARDRLLSYKKPKDDLYDLLIKLKYQNTLANDYIDILEKRQVKLVTLCAVLIFSAITLSLFS